jgi:hypothetical protein
LKIHPTTSMQATRKSSVMPRLVAALTSVVVDVPFQTAI